MSKTIQIKRGLKAGLPNLDVGELGYATDTNEFFIGTDSGNVLINEFDSSATYANLRAQATTAEDVGLGNVDNVKQAVVEYYTTTIATTDWSGTDPVTAVKTVSGVLSTDKPLIDIDLSSVAFGDVEAKQTEYAKIYRVAATDDDEITFYALEAPTEELVINIKVVR